MKIRPARAADRAEWARLRRALWPDCRGPRAALEMRELLSDPKKFGVLVLDRAGGKLGGFVEVALRDGVDGAARAVTAYIEGWFVAPELRGKNWGRKLIAAAGRWARARGMVELASDAEAADSTPPSSLVKIVRNPDKNDEPCASDPSRPPDRHAGRSQHFSWRCDCAKDLRTGVLNLLFVDQPPDDIGRNHYVGETRER